MSQKFSNILFISLIILSSFTLKTNQTKFQKNYLISSETIERRNNSSKLQRSSVKSFQFDDSLKTMDEPKKFDVATALLTNEAFTCYKKFETVISNFPTHVQETVVSEFKNYFAKRVNTPFNTATDACCDVQTMIAATSKQVNLITKNFAKLLTEDEQNCKKGFGCFRANEVLIKALGEKLDKNVLNQNQENLKNVVTKGKTQNFNMIRCLIEVAKITTRNAAMICEKPDFVAKLYVLNAEGKAVKPRRFPDDDLNVYESCGDFVKTFNQYAEEITNTFIKNLNLLMSNDKCNYFSQTFDLNREEINLRPFFKKQSNKMKNATSRNQTSVRNVTEQYGETTQSLLDRWYACAKTTTEFNQTKVEDLKTSLPENIRQHPKGLKYVRSPKLNVREIRHNFDLISHPSFHVSCANNTCQTYSKTPNGKFNSTNVVRTPEIALDYSCCNQVCVVQYANLTAKVLNSTAPIQFIELVGKARKESDVVASNNTHSNNVTKVHNKTHGNKTHGNKTHGNKTHGNETHGNEIHGNNTHSNNVTKVHNKTHGNKTHGNKTHGNKTHGNKTHGNKTHGNETHGNKTHSAKNNKTSSLNVNLAHGKRTLLGNDTAGNNTNGNKTHGNKTHGNKTHGNKTHSRRSKLLAGAEVFFVKNNSQYYIESTPHNVQRYRSAAKCISNKNETFNNAKIVSIVSDLSTNYSSYQNDVRLEASTLLKLKLSDQKNVTLGRFVLDDLFKRSNNSNLVCESGKCTLQETGKPDVTYDLLPNTNFSLNHKKLVNKTKPVKKVTAKSQRLYDYVSNLFFGNDNKNSLNKASNDLNKKAQKGFIKNKNLLFNDNKYSNLYYRPNYSDLNGSNTNKTSSNKGNILSYVPYYLPTFNRTQYVLDLNQNIANLNLYAQCCEYLCVMVIKNDKDNLISAPNMKRVHVEVFQRKHAYLSIEAFSLTQKKCIVKNVLLNEKDETDTSIPMSKRPVKVNIVDTCNLQTFPLSGLPIQTDCLDSLVGHCKHSNFFDLYNRHTKGVASSDDLPADKSKVNTCQAPVTCANVSGNSTVQDKKTCGVSIISMLLVEGTRVSLKALVTPCSGNVPEDSAAPIVFAQMKLRKTLQSTTQTDVVDLTKLSTEQKALLTAANTGVTAVVDTGISIDGLTKDPASLAKSVQADLVSVNNAVDATVTAVPVIATTASSNLTYGLFTVFITIMGLILF